MEEEILNMKSKTETYTIIIPEVLEDYNVKWKPVEVLAWSFEDFPELVIYERGRFFTAHKNSGLIIKTAATLGEAKRKLKEAQNTLDECKKSHWEKISLETDFRNNIIKRQGE